MIRLAIFAPSYSDEIFLQCFYGLKSAQIDLAVNRNETLELFYFDNNNLPSNVDFCSDDVRVLHIAQNNYFDGVISLGGVLSYIDTGGTLSPFLRDTFPGKPVINVMSRLDGVPSIFLDNKAAMHMIVDHLTQKHGYSRIGIVNGLPGHPDTQARRDAFIERMKDYNLSVPKEWEFPGDFMSPSGRDTAEKWIEGYQNKENLPEALVFTNDAMAHGFINKLNEWNMARTESIPIPGICGFDNRDFSMSITPGITSVTHPIYTFAKRAVELIVAHIIDNEVIPVEVLIPPELVIRRSCGCTDSNDAALSPVYNKFQNEFQQKLNSLIHDTGRLKNANSMYAVLSTMITEIIYTIGQENMSILVTRGVQQFKEKVDKEHGDYRSENQRVLDDLLMLISQRTREHNLLLRQRSNHIHSFQEGLHTAKNTRDIIEILATSFRSFSLNKAVLVMDRALFPDCPSKKLTALWMNYDITFFSIDERIDTSIFSQAIEGDWVICGLQTGSDGYGYIVCDIEPRNITEVRALARSIGSKLIEFRRTRRLLETERYAGLGKLLKGFAHYIGTPLGNSITAVSVIENQLANFLSAPGSVEPKDIQLLHDAAVMGLRNIDMIRDMVEIFKRLSMVSEYHTWDFGVPELLLKSGLATEIILARQKSVNINAVYSTQVDSISFPTDSIRFVLHELIDNTLKFAFPDEKVKKKEISVIIETDDEQITIQYKDNGRGLNQGDIENLFVPFSRMGKNSEGMGMGLFAVKRIIHNLLGGTVEVLKSSKAGFHIILTIPVPTDRVDIPQDNEL